MSVRALLVERIGHLEQTADGQRHGQHAEGAADVAHHGDHRLRQSGNQADARGDDQRRDDVGQAADDALVAGHHVAADAGETEGAMDAADQQALDDPVGQPGDERQEDDTQGGEQLRLALQPLQPGGQFGGHGYSSSMGSGGASVRALDSGLERADEDARVDPGVVEADVPVQVRPGGAAGGADLAEYGAARQLVADFDADL
ncbi:hypothetical protein D3C81_1528900 [compost metagenome]